MSNPHSSVKKILFTVNQILQGDTLRYLKQLEHWEWLDNSRSSSLQKDRLKKLIIHAYRHVPYYREVIGNNVVDSSGEVNLKYFDQIPLLDKATVRTRFEDLKSDDLSRRRWHHNSSGGSTGEPVTFIQDKEYYFWTTAIKILYDSWTGCSIGDRKVRLWGSIQDLSFADESLKNRLIKWMDNSARLNAFRMTPAEMEAYVEKINEFGPVQIIAYAESIYELSRFIEDKGIRVFSPQAIMTSAGTLFPHMRETIGRVFKAPVFNRYGSREVGDIACECPHHFGLHVCSPTHYVEILRPDGSPADPNEMGEIVVTSLVNYAMPMIRYRIGDMGIWSDQACSCGRGWPLIKEISGRITDVFLRKDGGIVSPEYLIHLIGVELNNGWIRRFQAIQEDYNHLRILIVTGEPVDNPKAYYGNEISKISEGIHLVMGQDCRVEYEFVNDIAPAVSGKFRYTISKISQ